LYKKADYDSINREVEAFSDTFIEKNKNNNDIDTIWNEFKTFVKDQVNKYIPKCTITHNTGYPWITSTQSDEKRRPCIQQNSETWQQRKIPR
jgi:hypothetical protein